MPSRRADASARVAPVYRLVVVSMSTLLVVAFAACKSVDHSETAAAPHDDDLFVNDVVGFSVRKPPSWRFAPTAWAEANFDRLDFKDDEFARFALENATEPLVVIMKYDDDADVLSPVFRATFRPLGQLSELSPEQIAAILIPSFRETFAGFELIDGVARTEVSGLAAVHFSSVLTVDDLAGATHSVLSEIWLVKRGAYLFILGASAPQEDPSPEDLHAIVQSIAIDPRGF